jgi:hypothetical protein
MLVALYTIVSHTAINVCNCHFCILKPSLYWYRMLAERIICRGRTSIIEHHRAVSWGEREYAAFYALVLQNQTYILQKLQRPGNLDPLHLSFFDKDDKFKDNQKPRSDGDDV